MGKYALEVKHVSKSFRLPTEQANGIKQAFVNWTKGIKGYKEQHVLKDISFKVEKGDFFGIVGRNGSGKSTLLKIISQIYTPEKEIYNFEDNNIDRLIFKAIKGLMESKLSYENIGIGRSKEESYKDYLTKQGNNSAPVYCQDSLALHLGLVLTKRRENDYSEIYT